MCCFIVLSKYNLLHLLYNYVVKFSGASDSGFFDERTLYSEPVYKGHGLMSEIFSYNTIELPK